MNEYGDNEPTDQTRPIDGSWRQSPPSPQQAGPQFTPPTGPSYPAPGPLYPTPTNPQYPTQAGPPYEAPTWQWTGMPPAGPSAYGGQAPGPAGQPFGPTQRTHLTRRAKLLGVAAALVLVGGAAAGGVAFGFEHSGSSSATGIAQGQIGAGTTPGQTPPSPPTQKPPTQTPPTGGKQHQPRQRGGGHASSFAGGQATDSQVVGVVDINTKLKYEVAKAAGTGMILTSTGEILTNNHVVEGATKIKVTVVATGKKYDATVVGTDKVDDIAVLQLTGASGLSTVTTNTAQVKVGDAVTAVGNAMGAGGTPSAAKGSVTGINRSITTQSETGVDGERLTGMIQVNAQVIAGDSGGPLYNGGDQVIGMDTAASSSPSQSVGFAIPIVKALSIATQIQNGNGGGNISLGVPGFLGVSFGSSYDQSSQSGAVIAGVVRNSPAASQGLAQGDTITRVNGTAITSGAQLKTVLSTYKGGDTVSLTWTDTKGGSHTAGVQLIAGPAE